VPAAAGASSRAFPWERAATAGPLLLADGSGPPEQASVVRTAWDEAALHVRFDCADRDAWGTYRQRNDPLYLEEAVEIFLAPGPAVPRRYWEIEVSPAGVVFAAAIHNPTGRRADLVADTGWECRGLQCRSGPAGTSQDWWAELAVPWSALGPARTADSEAPPAVWRANFYRIERPRDGRGEFSCWSPTLTAPADFHRPERFGVLELTGRCS
jgi:hypothetical protein